MQGPVADNRATLFQDAKEIFLNARKALRAHIVTYHQAQQSASVKSAFKSNQEFTVLLKQQGYFANNAGPRNIEVEYLPGAEPIFLITDMDTQEKLLCVADPNEETLQPINFYPINLHPEKLSTAELIFKLSGTEDVQYLLEAAKQQTENLKQQCAAFQERFGHEINVVPLCEGENQCCLLTGADKTDLVLLDFQKNPIELVDVRNIDFITLFNIICNSQVISGLKSAITSADADAALMSIEKYFKDNFNREINIKYIAGDDPMIVLEDRSQQASYMLQVNDNKQLEVNNIASLNLWAFMDYMTDANSTSLIDLYDSLSEASAESEAVPCDALTNLLGTAVSYQCIHPEKQIFIFTRQKGDKTEYAIVNLEDEEPELTDNYRLMNLLTMVKDTECYNTFMAQVRTTHPGSKEKEVSEKDLKNACEELAKRIGRDMQLIPLRHKDKVVFFLVSPENHETLLLDLSDVHDPQLTYAQAATVKEAHDNLLKDCRAFKALKLKLSKKYKETFDKIVSLERGIRSVYAGKINIATLLRAMLVEAQPQHLTEIEFNELVPDRDNLPHVKTLLDKLRLLVFPKMMNQAALEQEFGMLFGRKIRLSFDVAAIEESYQLVIIDQVNQQSFIIDNFSTFRCFTDCSTLHVSECCERLKLSQVFLEFVGRMRVNHQLTKGGSVNTIPAGATLADLSADITSWTGRRVGHDTGVLVEFLPSIFTIFKVTEAAKLEAWILRETKLFEHNRAAIKSLSDQQNDIAILMSLFNQIEPLSDASKEKKRRKQFLKQLKSQKEAIKYIIEHMPNADPKFITAPTLFLKTKDNGVDDKDPTELSMTRAVQYGSLQEHFVKLHKERDKAAAEIQQELLARIQQESLLFALAMARKLHVMALLDEAIAYTDLKPGNVFILDPDDHDVILSDPKAMVRIAEINSDRRINRKDIRITYSKSQRDSWVLSKTYYPKEHAAKNATQSVRLNSLYCYQVAKLIYECATNRYAENLDGNYKNVVDFNDAFFNSDLGGFLKPILDESKLATYTLESLIQKLEKFLSPELRAALSAVSPTESPVTSPGPGKKRSGTVSDLKKRRSKGGGDDDTLGRSSEVSTSSPAIPTPERSPDVTTGTGSTTTNVSGSGSAITGSADGSSNGGNSSPEKKEHSGSGTGSFTDSGEEKCISGPEEPTADAADAIKMVHGIPLSRFESLSGLQLDNSGPSPDATPRTVAATEAAKRLQTGSGKYKIGANPK